MKNREKYKAELMEACREGGNLNDFFDVYVKPFYNTDDWAAIGYDAAAILITLWLDEEYVEPEPEIDWSEVETDTPILVRDDDCSDWTEGYFAGYSDEGEVYTWENGTTSWSNQGGKTPWKYAKLAEEE